MTMHFIASHTVTSDGAVGANFTSIPQTFSHLQLRIVGRSTLASASDNMYCRFNGDASAIYTGNAVFGDGTNVGQGNYMGYDAWEIGIVAGGNATTNVFSAVISDISDYSRTGKNKTIQTVAGYDNNGNGLIILRSGLYSSTNAITSLYVSYPPFKAGTRFDLYGITSNPIATGA